MRIVRDFVEEEELQSFADRNGLEVHIHERPGRTGLGRVYATLEPVPGQGFLEIMWMGGLLSTFGDGWNEDSAIKALCKEFSNKRLVMGAYTDKRREFSSPKLYYDPHRTDNAS